MDAHANEYLGAVAGMAELYGDPLPPIGSEIAYKVSDNPFLWEKGVYVGVSDDGLVMDINVHPEAVNAPVDIKKVPRSSRLPF